MEALPIVGGLIGSSAAGDAADAQAAGTAAGIAEQRRQFDLVRGDTAQARGVGQSALAQLARELGLSYNLPGAGGTMSEAQIRQMLTGQYTTPATPDRYAGGDADVVLPGSPATVRQDELDAAVQQMLSGQQGGGVQNNTAPPQEVIDPTKEPGYQFGLQQGQTALDRRIAAMGGRVSGAALKASTRYNQDYATTGYQAAYQRQNSARSERLNRLQQLAGFGQTAAATSGNAGANTSNAISGMLTSQGDASGSAKLAQGNIWGDTFNQVAAGYKSRTNPLASYGMYGTTGNASTMGFGGEY